MSQAPEQEVVGFRLVPPTDTRDAPNLYSNFIQATMSPHDFTLHLGWFSFPALLERPQEDVEVPVRLLATVTLPLNLMPGLIDVLQSQVANWAKVFRDQAPSPPGSGDPSSDVSREPAEES